MTFSTPVRFLAAAAIVALAGCGGSTTSTSTTVTAKATTEAQREMAALPSGATAPVPSDLKCGAVKPVWVNLNTKSYHTSDDPYYGKTKNGKYECPSAAVADGYHAAGAMHHHKKKSSAMSSAASSDDTSTP